MYLGLRDREVRLGDCKGHAGRMSLEDQGNRFGPDPVGSVE